MTRLSSRAAALVAAVALFAVGCDSGPKIVPASGTVLIDGVPLTHGVVQIVPDDFRPASGKIEPDGRFTLTTLKPDDGCLVGTHKATVVATESLGPGAQKWHAPRKYAALA